MTTKPRPTAPRAAALAGSLAVHAAVLAAAAMVPTPFVSAAHVQARAEGPTVLAWIAPQHRPDDVVVAAAPAAEPATVPAPARDAGRPDAVVLDEPVLPPRVDAPRSDAP